MYGLPARAGPSLCEAECYEAKYMIVYTQLTNVEQYSDTDSM